MSFETLTVGELITQLKQFPENMPVIAVSNYGNRQQTMQAIPVNNLEDGFSIKQSAYSDSDYACVNSWANESFDEYEHKNVVVLNAGDMV